MKKVKATITLSPVAWSGEKVLKYQAVGECSGKRFFGDPKRTKQDAILSLQAELSQRLSAIQNIQCEINGGNIKILEGDAEDHV